ncbi:MAG: PLP-dependent aminotransferase family protein, partial [Pseudomonas sp.]|nr:PLP-dependent aminotransferase family protein [Pseudomonas sp.]
MNRAPALPFDLSGIRLQPGQGLARQLYQALRERILDGRLAGGTRLPASRELAALLGISRNTVTRALDQLYAEGYVAGRVGDGTYIAELPRSRPAAATAVTPAAASPALQLLQNHHLAMPAKGAPRAFRIGVPAFDLFPFETWARLQARFWRKPSPARLGYGDPAGDIQLRELIAAYLRSSRGLTCEATQVLITCGSQQAISLCAQLLVQPGARVALENPGYRAAGHAFAVAGAQLCGIAVDGEGMDIDALQRLNDCQLAYVTP